MSIPFIDLKAQRQRLGDRIDKAILDVVNHGAYIMGPEVKELEKQLAEFCGARHCLSCANGTDALALILMAWGIKPGDAVYVPAFTFVATAEVVAWFGATPVFVDVLEDTFNMDPDSLETAIAAAGDMNLTPRAVIPVDLFGQPADYRRILPIAEHHGLKVLSDTAQGFGATLDGKMTGTFGDATATSFFPAKPLSCYGDGGAVFTDDDTLAADLHSLRVHGQGSDTVRQRTHRHERAHGHHAGGGGDRKVAHLQRRDRRPPAGCRLLCGRSRRRHRRAAAHGRRDFRVGAIHDPARRPRRGAVGL